MSEQVIENEDIGEKAGFAVELFWNGCPKAFFMRSENKKSIQLFDSAIDGEVAAENLMAKWGKRLTYVIRKISIRVSFLD